VGSKVSLVIRSADSPRVGLRGEVVRVEPASGRVHPSYDVGVRLLPNPDRSAHLIPRGAKAPAGA
jgi:hypothetical protein